MSEFMTVTVGLDVRQVRNGWLQCGRTSCLTSGRSRYDEEAVKALLRPWPGERCCYEEARPGSACIGIRVGAGSTARGRAGAGGTDYGCRARLAASLGVGGWRSVASPCGER